MTGTDGAQPRPESSLGGATDTLESSCGSEHNQHFLNGSLEPVLNGFYMKMKIEPFYRLSPRSLRSKMTFAVVGVKNC